MMRFLAPLALLTIVSPIFADCGVRAIYQNRAVVVKVERRVFFSVGEDILSNEDIRRVADAVTGKLEVVGEIGNPTPPRDKAPSIEIPDFNLVGASASPPQKGSDSKVFAIMNTSCIQCHKPGARSPGNVQLFTADRKLFVAVDTAQEKKRRGRIADSVDISNGGTMPKDRSRLSASQIALLRRWSEE